MQIDDEIQQVSTDGAYDQSDGYEMIKDTLGQSTPEIFNTDPGSQFTSAEFTNRVKKAGAAVSQDGQGRALDNIFVERLWS